MRSEVIHLETPTRELIERYRRNVEDKNKFESHIWDSRVQANWEGGKLSVVSREGLIALKKLGGRPQDLADISALTEESDDATN